MTTDYQHDLLADAAKVAATDLYPERCRTLIERLAAELSTILNAVASGALVPATDAEAHAALARAMQKTRDEDRGRMLHAAVEEYVLRHASEGPDARLGRASAVRGMAVRMDFYTELEQAIDEALMRTAALQPGDGQ